MASRICCIGDKKKDSLPLAPSPWRERGNCNTINTPFGQKLCFLILQGCEEGGMRYHQYPVRPKTLLPYTPRARRGGNAIPSIPRSAKTFASLYSKGAKRGNCNTINTPFGQNLCILILQGCGEGGMRYHQYPVRPKTLLPYTPRARRGGNAIPSNTPFGIYAVRKNNYQY